MIESMIGQGCVRMQELWLEANAYPLQCQGRFDERLVQDVELACRTDVCTNYLLERRFFCIIGLGEVDVVDVGYGACARWRSICCLGSEGQCIQDGFGLGR